MSSDLQQRDGHNQPVSELSVRLSGLGVPKNISQRKEKPTAPLYITRIIRKYKVTRAKQNMQAKTRVNISFTLFRFCTSVLSDFRSVTIFFFSSTTHGFRHVERGPSVASPYTLICHHCALRSVSIGSRSRRKQRRRFIKENKKKKTTVFASNGRIPRATGSSCYYYFLFFTRYRLPIRTAGTTKPFSRQSDAYNITVRRGGEKRNHDVTSRVIRDGGVKSTADQVDRGEGRICRAGRRTRVE